MSTESQLREKLRKIEALFAGAGKKQIDELHNVWNKMIAEKFYSTGITSYNQTNTISKTLIFGFFQEAGSGALIKKECGVSTRPHTSLRAS